MKLIKKSDQVTDTGIENATPQLATAADATVGSSMTRREFLHNSSLVAGGAALVRAAGGAVWRPDGEPLRFNRPKTLLPGLIAVPNSIESGVREYLASHA